MACQRMIEVEQYSILSHLLDRTRISSLSVGRWKFNDFANLLGLERVPHLLEQLSTHPLQHIGIA